MNRPNADQVRAAAAIMKQFAASTKGSASDTQTETAVYSVAAALGAPGQPAQEYADAIEKATNEPTPTVQMLEGDENEFTVVAENPLGLPVGKTYYSYEQENASDDEPDGDTSDVNENGDGEFDDGSNTDNSDDGKDTGYSMEELGKMNKDDLVAAVNAELADTFDEDAPQITKDYGSKAEIIESVGVLRETGAWPEEDEEAAS